MTQAATKPSQHREPDAAFNAGDEASVKAREKKSKEREDVRIAGLKTVMATRQGRAWMRHLLVEKLFIGVGATLPPDSFTGNSGTFYNCGAKRVGENLAAELKVLCRAEFRLMEDEGDE